MYLGTGIVRSDSLYIELILSGMMKLYPDTNAIRSDVQLAD
jgi:hypothetical protein